MASFEDLIYPLLRSYIAAPQWVKHGLGWAYSTLPVSLRYGRAYRRFQLELAEQNPLATTSLARAKLRQTLECAIRTVPAYREFESLLKRDCAPEELLAALPLTTKQEIKQDGTRYVSTGLPPRQRLATFTGGSTSQPMRVYLQCGVTRAKEFAFMRDFHARAGMQEGDVALALRGRTVPGAHKPDGPLSMFEPIKRQLILSSDHLERRYMARYVADIRRWWPRYIQAFPSALYPLAKWLQENPAPEITGSIRGIFLYSENVYEFQRELFREVFGCPVLGHYGHSERVLMAATLPEDGRYYFWPLYGHVELLDQAGRPITTPGVLGELVGTSFDNEAMPFVRYRTGDLGMLSNRPAHARFSGYPVFERVEGRTQDFLVCRDSRLISITTVGAAHLFQLERFDAIQYEQHEAGRAVLKVVSREPVAQTAEAAIRRAFLEKTQGGCDIEVVRVEAIPRTARGKQLMLVQHLDLRRYFGAVDAVQTEAADRAPR